MHIAHILNKVRMSIDSFLPSFVFVRKPSYPENPITLSSYLQKSIFLCKNYSSCQKNNYILNKSQKLNGNPIFTITNKDSLLCIFFISDFHTYYGISHFLIGDKFSIYTC